LDLYFGYIFHVLFSEETDSIIARNR